MENDTSLVRKLHSDICNKSELLDDFCGFIGETFGFNIDGIRNEIKRFTTK